MEDDLVAWGRVVRIEALGRRSGRVVPVVVGFVERPGGAIVVAATAPDSAWSGNLLAEPRCRVTIGDGVVGRLRAAAPGPGARRRGP